MLHHIHHRRVVRKHTLRHAVQSGVIAATFVNSLSKRAVRLWSDVRGRVQFGYIQNFAAGNA
jgi:hypothetical protein